VGLGALVDGLARDRLARFSMSSTLAGDFIRNWLFDLAILPFCGSDLIVAAHSGGILSSPQVAL
jgi:hypothetical protein